MINTIKRNWIIISTMVIVSGVIYGSLWDISENKANIHNNKANLEECEDAHILTQKEASAVFSEIRETLSAVKVELIYLKQSIEHLNKHIEKG